MAAGDLRALQETILALKRRQGFNLTDVPLELSYLHGEIAEFFEAWRENRDDLGEELADVAVYVLGLAGIVGVDLESEIAAKMEKNARRRYVERDGVLRRADDGA